MQLHRDDRLGTRIPDEGIQPAPGSVQRPAFDFRLSTFNRLRLRLRLRAARAYTLIEVSAVIAIVLVMMFAGAAAIRSVRKADISTSAGMLSASIRYLYDLAVLNNRSYRMVIDLGGGAWWAEMIDPASASCGGGLLPSEEERRFGEREKDRRKGASAEKQQAVSGELNQLLGGFGAGTPMAAPGAAEGGGGGSEASGHLKDNLLSRRALPKGLSFSMVMTSHQDEPTEEGRAEIYFFPDGYVERAFIYLKRDETVYTVETVPLKGVGVVHPEELDSRDLVDRS